MHDSWHILSRAWSAVVIVYCVLYLVGSRRLRSREAKRSTGRLFWLVVVLAVIREFIWFTLGRGLMYRVALLLVGVAAGIAALVLTAALITQEPGDGNVSGDEDHDEGIQSLKLS